MRMNVLMKVFLIVEVICSLSFAVHAMEESIGGCALAGKLEQRDSHQASKVFYVVGQAPNRADHLGLFCGACCGILRDLSDATWRDVLNLSTQAGFETSMQGNLLLGVSDYLRTGDTGSIYTTCCFQDMVWIPGGQLRQAVFVSLSAAVLKKTAEGPLMLVFVLHEQHLDGPVVLSGDFISTLTELAITTPKNPAIIQTILEFAGDPALHVRSPEEQRAPQPDSCS